MVRSLKMSNLCLLLKVELNSPEFQAPAKFRNHRKIVSSKTKSCLSIMLTIPSRLTWSSTSPSGLAQTMPDVEKTSKKRHTSRKQKKDRDWRRGPMKRVKANKRTLLPTKRMMMEVSTKSPSKSKTRRWPVQTVNRPSSTSWVLKTKTWDTYWRSQEIKFMVSSSRVMEQFKYQTNRQNNRKSQLLHINWGLQHRKATISQKMAFLLRNRKCVNLITWLNRHLWRSSHLGHPWFLSTLHKMRRTPTGTIKHLQAPHYSKRSNHIKLTVSTKILRLVTIPSQGLARSITTTSITSSLSTRLPFRTSRCPHSWQRIHSVTSQSVNPKVQEE